MRKLSVVLAVAPQSLGRVIEHLLAADACFRIIQRLSPGEALARRARDAAPDLVVANLRFLGREHERSVMTLRRSSPASKVLLIYSFPRPRRLGGAHAHLDEQAVVRRLLGALRKLARCPGGADCHLETGSPRRAAAGREASARLSRRRPGGGSASGEWHT